MMLNRQSKGTAAPASLDTLGQKYSYAAGPSAVQAEASFPILMRNRWILNNKGRFHGYFRPAAILPKKYIDSASNFCNPCSSAPAGQITACKNCAFPFVRGNTGCVLCLTLANNGGSDSCCATGYKFNSATGSCVCDLGSGYAVAANGVCTQCIGTDTNCINCVNTYFYNGAFCIFGALIPNLDPATGSCKPGYAVKTDVATGVKISCACATSQGFYQNGAQCNSCTTSPPATITTATCKTCPLASKFYPGSPECIYCPGVAFSTAAVPTANGCS
ncbi:hypothetical protein DAPPUDRAFT_123809, partial [Daphnia pulex]